MLDECLAERASLSEYFFSRSPLVPLACAFIAGLIIQHYFDLPVIWPLLILALCTICSLVIFSVKKISPPLNTIACIASVGFVCLSAVRLASFNQPAPDNISNFVADEKVLADIQGIVLTIPRLEDTDAWQFSRFSWTEPGTSFYLKLDNIKTNSGWQKVTGTVRVQLSGSADDIKTGDSIRAFCWLSRFKSPLNPGQFDVKKYLARRHVFIAATISSRDGIEIIKTSRPAVFLRIRNRFRTIAAQALFGQTLPRENANPLLTALLLGERADLNPVIYEAFRKTGLAHFICLSGMHMGILAAFVWFVCKTIGLTKRPRAFVCIIVIVLYTLVVPPRAATLRAAVICFFFCISVIIRKRPNPLNTLSFAAIVLLLIRPMDLFSPGFQLSYTTVLGILLFERHIRNRLFEITIDRIKLFRKDSSELIFPMICLRVITIFIIELLSVGLSAWLGGVGILLYHFGSITPSAFIWTVLAFPLVLGILIFGFLKILLAPLLPTLSLLIGIIANSLADFFARLVTLIAAFDVSRITVGKVSIILILFYYCFLLIIRFGRFKKYLLKKTLFTTMAAVIIFSIGLIKYRTIHRRDLELTCLSIGHGQAVFIAMPGNKNFLLDAGSLSAKDPGQRIVLPFFNQKGISHLDAVILSHDDIDHINAVPEIVSQCKVDAVYVNSAFMQNANTFSTAGFLRNCLNNCGLQLKLLDDSFQTKQNPKIKFLWPNPNICSDNTISDNDKSLVILIEFAGKKMLFCSDIEVFAQSNILSSYPNLKADVIVMPHHGSTRNLLDSFTERLDPHIVIISCSRSRYEKAFKTKGNVTAFYTPVDGAVTVKIKADGEIVATSFVKHSKL